MRNWSQDAADVWNVYANEFKERWGIDHAVSAVVGARSKSIFAAEFHEHGAKSYKSSVILPIRNAFYAASQADERWEKLSGAALVEPILDYGCGVGVQLLWLKRHGFRDLYGHELPGIQRSIMASVFQKHGINVWAGEPVKTILCLNVLEHVADPVAMLTGLMKEGRRVIANICTDHDSPHIAPHDKLEECRKMLEASGGLYVG